MVTDWDCWREAEAGAEASEVMRVMAGNARIALDMLGHFARALPAKRDSSPIDCALDGAIVTHTAARDPALVARLGAVAGRVLRTGGGA
jgi:5'-methylthioadenosine phosphorylase